MANPTRRMIDDSGRSSILGVIEKLHARLRAIALQATGAGEDASWTGSPTPMGGSSASGPHEDATSGQAATAIIKAPPRSRLEVQESGPTPVVGAVDDCSGGHDWTAERTGRNPKEMIDDGMGEPRLRWICRRCGAVTDADLLDTAETESAGVELGGGRTWAPNEKPSGGRTLLDGLVADELLVEVKSDSEVDGTPTAKSIGWQCSICDEPSSASPKIYRNHEVCGACYAALTR